MSPTDEQISTLNSDQATYNATLATINGKLNHVPGRIQPSQTDWDNLVAEGAQVKADLDAIANS